MHCENCGALINARSKFCVNCGGRIAQDSSPGQVPEGVGRVRKKSPRALVIICILSIPVILIGIIILWSLFPGDELSEARKILQEASQTAATIESDVAKADALVNIAKAQVKAGDPGAARMTLQQALQAAASIKNQPEKVYILGNIAGAQAEAGDVAAALQTAAGDSRALVLIAKAQAEAGDRVAAGTTFQRALQTAAGNPYALLSIAQAQAEVGDVSGAFQTAAAISNDFAKASAFGTIAKAQVRAGDSAAGRSTFQQALQTATGIHDDSKAHALRYIATAQAEAGDRVAAGTTFQRALQTATGIKNDSLKASYLADIAGAQAEAGDVRGALHSAAGIHDDSSRSMALWFIAAAQAEAGDVTAALQTAAGIQNDSAKAAALPSIAVAMVKTGNVTGALQTAASMQDGPKGLALFGIAKAQAKAVGAKAALEWAAKEIPSYKRDDFLLAVAEGILERIEARKFKVDLPKQRK